MSAGRLRTEQAAIMCLYLVKQSPALTGKGRAKWVPRQERARVASALTIAG
jgi:hypothetical protein